MIEKPPLGIKPRHVHDSERAIEIAKAIARYIEARKKVPIEWTDELMEILNYQKL